MLYLILTVGFIGATFAQAPGIGSCPTVNTISSFDWTKFMGLWYENRKSFPDVFEIATKCSTLTFSDNKNNTIHFVKHKISWLTRMESEVEGTGRIDPDQCGNSTDCAKFIVEYPLPIGGYFQTPLWVLDTDYISYAISWSCMDIVLNNIHLLWVLTRDPIPSADVLDKANSVIKENGLEDVLTIPVDQTNCP